MDIDALPKPKPITLEEHDANQLKLKKPTEARVFQRAYAVIAESEHLTELTPFQAEDLARAYADIGQFDKASELDTPKSDFYARVWKAVHRPDDERCDCPQTVGKGKDRYDPRFVLRNVFSPKHGEAKLIACNTCGDFNVVQ